MSSFLVIVSVPIKRLDKSMKTLAAACSFMPRQLLLLTTTSNLAVAPRRLSWDCEHKAACVRTFLISYKHSRRNLDKSNPKIYLPLQQHVSVDAFSISSISEFSLVIRLN